jgi:hypothetical protein
MAKLNKMAAHSGSIKSFKVLVECVGCKTRKEIDPRDVDELGPSCDKCYMPMVVIRAEIRR